eukprot:tig00000571_g2181.t1
MATGTDHEVSEFMRGLEILDWDLGESWYLTEPGGALKAGAGFSKISSLQNAEKHCAFSYRLPLFVRRVFQTGHPLWLADLGGVGGTSLLVDAGLASALLIPIAATAGVVRGVAVLFSCTRREIDPALLRAASRLKAGPSKAPAEAQARQPAPAPAANPKKRPHAVSACALPAKFLVQQGPKRATHARPVHGVAGGAGVLPRSPGPPPSAARLDRERPEFCQPLMRAVWNGATATSFAQKRQQLAGDREAQASFLRYLISDGAAAGAGAIARCAQHAADLAQLSGMTFAA